MVLELSPRSVVLQSLGVSILPCTKFLLTKSLLKRVDFLEFVLESQSDIPSWSLCVCAKMAVP
jgi:hypothetical protein